MSEVLAVHGLTVAFPAPGGPRQVVAGIDFGVAADGSVLLFEANATMAILTPAADPIWDYRRAPIGRALAAATRLVRTRAATDLAR